MSLLENEEKAAATVRCKRQIEANGKLRKLHEQFKVTVVVDPKTRNRMSFEQVAECIAKNNNENINKKLFPLKISDELLMAIASTESGKAVQPNGRNGEITDIYFDPCAQNISSTAMGLMQIKGEFFEEYINQGYIISNESPPHVHAKLCGNPDLAVEYALVVLNEKYKIKSVFTDSDERLVETIKGYGEGDAYARDIIQIRNALKEVYPKRDDLQKDYTKAKKVLLDKMNEQLKRKNTEGTPKNEDAKAEAMKGVADGKW